jgi:hypothetical protein
MPKRTKEEDLHRIVMVCGSPSQPKFRSNVGGLADSLLISIVR